VSQWSHPHEPLTPAAPAVEPVAAPPEDFLVWSVLATILCFPPTGAGALLWARRVHARYAAGDLNGAREASRQARAWLVVTLACGVVLYALLFLVAFLVGAAGS
jgi:hypothetical protein